VGLGIAKEWAFSGRRIDAAEAYRTGLANQVHPAGQVFEAARALALSLAERNPLALALAKRALDPEPPAADGLVGAFHMLASQACHDAGDFSVNTDRYVAKRHGGEKEETP